MTISKLMKMAESFKRRENTVEKKLLFLIVFKRLALQTGKNQGLSSKGIIKPYGALCCNGRAWASYTKGQEFESGNELSQSKEQLA